MPAKLTQTQINRIVALIEAYPDAFHFCLDELAGDSVLAEDKQRAERDISDHEHEMKNRPSRRDPDYLLDANAMQECRDAIEAVEAIMEAADIIKKAIGIASQANQSKAA